jgi:hypothetical protein
MYRHLSSALLLVLLVNTSFAQADRLIQKIEGFYRQFPQEKFYVQTDKPYYALGETIWCKAWALEARRLSPSALSATFYLELLNAEGKVVAIRNLKAQQGSAQADIQIPFSWNQGRYQLRVYSQYMLNFDPLLLFQKEILIWSTTLPYTPPAKRQDFTLQFAPEGGDLVVGLSSRVGVKAVDQSGNGIDLSGKIVNDLGGVIGSFSTRKFGLGMFDLLPRAERKYFAEVEYQGKTLRKELPAVLPQGYTLRVFRPAPGFIQVLAQCNRPEGLKGAFMVGQIRGEVFWSQTCQGGSDEQWRMPIDSLPEGVAQFTLFAPGGEPVAERLIFVENPLVKHEAKLQLISGAPHLPHQKISVMLELKDAKNNPAKGTFAATVTDRASVQWQPNEQDIRSYLLLQSDVKGRIEQAAYFFNTAHNDRQLLLDILLLTQGWRRFSWREILRDTLPKITYAAEKNGFLLTGLVTKANAGNQPAEADLMLSVSGSKSMIMPYGVEKDGRFAYAVELSDTSSILLQASSPKAEKSSKSKKKNDSPIEEFTYRINLDKVDAPVLKTSHQQTVAIEAPSTQRFIAQSRQMLVQDSAKLIVADNPLATATVKTKRKEEQLPNGVPSLPYGTPQHRIIMDSLPFLANNGSVFDLIVNRVSGVRQNGGSLNVRGAASFVSDDRPLYLLDGAEVGEAQASSLNLGEIAFIDVFKNADEATLYGSRGANGVVAIYTRRDGSVGNLNNSAQTKKSAAAEKGALNFRHPGYYKARQFYAPTYDIASSTPTKRDLRTTLHWQPELKINDLGQATFSFFTADVANGFDILVEGISETGYPLRMFLPIEVKSER